MQPLGARSVQACKSLAGTFLRTHCPAPRADQERVSNRNLHPCLPLPRLQVLGINGRSLFQVIHTSESGEVHQDAPRQNARLSNDNGILRTATRIDLIYSETIEDFSLITD